MKRPSLKVISIAAITIASLAAGLITAAYMQTRTLDSGNEARLVNIELADVNQSIRRGKEWLGSVVVVNHWATWCPPCREEMPLLIDSQNTLSARGLQIVGIAHDSAEAARIYGDTIGINYPSLVADENSFELMQKQGNSGGHLPFTAVFDRNGMLVISKLGKYTKSELDQIILPKLEPRNSS